jgi:hypothetical protein
LNSFYVESFMPAATAERTGTRLAATSKVDAMFVAAEKIGLDLSDLELVRRRLATHEAERRWTRPSPRRTELDALIARDLDVLCGVFVKLRSEGGPSP